MKTFIKDAVARWSAETPRFFKKVIVGGVSVGGLGATLKGAAALGVDLPHIISDHIGHMITAGFISAAVAKFAKVDTPDQSVLPPPPAEPQQPK